MNFFSRRRKWQIDILFLTLVLGILFFCLLGTRPLFTPDEGRYAEIAREMVASGNYITPYLNGIKYFEKPILFYWLESFAIHVFGLNLWALRSINALLALFACLFTYFTASQLYDRKTGLYAAGILASSALYFTMAHMISLDLPVTVFMTAALYSFLLAQFSPSRKYYLWAAAAFTALALLTKGLIGILFPLLIIGAWVCTTREWRALKQLSFFSCLSIFLLLTVPWHWLVQAHNPEFFNFYVIQQHFLRYTTKEIGHYQPSWFFIPYLILGFFPWAVFLPAAFLKRNEPRLHSSRLEGSTLHEHLQKIDWFFVLWAILIFIFFSFSKSKLIPYILPIFPALAILTARFLRNNTATWLMKLSSFCLILLSFMIGIVLINYAHVFSLTAKMGLLIASLILIMGSLLTTYFSFRAPQKTVPTLFSTMFLFLLITLSIIPAIDTRTILPLAEIIRAEVKPHDTVVTYNQYYQDLPFYLQRTVSILNWQNELTFGMQHQKHHEWMINNTIFWQKWNSSQRLFVVLDRHEFDLLRQHFPQKKFYILGQTTHNLLISNQPKITASS